LSGSVTREAIKFQMDVEILPDGSLSDLVSPIDDTDNRNDGMGTCQIKG